MTTPGAQRDGLLMPEPPERAGTPPGITIALGPSSESDLGNLSSPHSSVPEDTRLLPLRRLPRVVTGPRGDISKELRDAVSMPLTVRAWAGGGAGFGH